MILDFKTDRKWGDFCRTTGICGGFYTGERDFCKGGPKPTHDRRLPTGVL